MTPYTYITPGGPGVDDAVAINAAFAAGARWVQLGAFEYEIASPIVVPRDCRLDGCGLYLTKLKATANFDCFIDAKWGSKVRGFYVNGNGFTSRGFVIRSEEFYQFLEDVGGWTSGYLVDFEAVGAGTNARIHGLSGARYDTSQWTVRILGDSLVSHGVRQIYRFFAGGAAGVDCGYSTSTLICDSNFVGLRTEQGSKNCRFYHNRIAGNSVDLRGTGHQYVLNSTSGYFQFWPGSSGCFLIGGNQMSGVADLNNGQTGNVIW